MTPEKAPTPEEARAEELLRQLGGSLFRIYAICNEGGPPNAQLKRATNLLETLARMVRSGRFNLE